MGDTIFMIHGMWGGPSNWANYRSIFLRLMATAASQPHCPTTTWTHKINQTLDSERPDLNYAAALEREIGQLGENRS